MHFDNDLPQPLCQAYGRSLSGGLRVEAEASVCVSRSSARNNRNRVFEGSDKRGASDDRIEAGFNWTGCYVTEIRGRATVVMTAPTSTSYERTETIKSDAVGHFARTTGLRRFSKAARLIGDAEVGILIVTSAGTVARTTQLGVAAISNRVGRLAELPDSVDVAIVAGGPHRGSTALQRLKSASERGLAVGMSARVLDLRPSTARIDDVGTFIGAGGEELEWPAPGDRVLLDQNILVSLDKCLAHNDAQLWVHLRDLFGWLATCDPVAGFAFAECVNAGSVALANRLQAAFAVFMRAAHEAASIDELRVASATYRPPPHESLDVGAARATALTDLNYLGILHALRVWRAIPTESFVPRIRLAAWKDWLGAVNVEYLGISAYCALAVRLLLLSENNGPRDSPGSLAMGLLKFRSTPTSANLRGAAWDLSYLFLADLARIGETDLEGTGPVVVLTADKALQGLARNGYLAGALYGPDRTTPVVVQRRQESAKFSAKQLAALEELDRQAAEAQQDRSESRTTTLNPVKLRAEIRALERELDLA